MTAKRSLLILSISDISQDARVLKQIALFADDWEVTTCGYGPRPPGVAHHLEIPPDEIYTDLDGRLITLVPACVPEHAGSEGNAAADSTVAREDGRHPCR